MSEFKDDFLRNLKVRHSDLEWTDPDKVSEAIDTLNDAFDKMSQILTPEDQEGIEEAVAQIICFNLPFSNADRIAGRIWERLRDWEVEE